MAGIMDDIAHLSQEIGPRPAGTEEEQQAALYIADELQKRAGFATVIEDFNCVPNADIVKLICFGVSFICALAALIFPVVAVPAFILGFIAAALFACEVFEKPVISRFLRGGVSQNVVAKYKPAPVGVVGKRRKVILVANYDSAKMMSEYRGPLKNNLHILQWITFGALIASPLFLLIRTVFFLNATGVIPVVFNVLIIITLVLMALPLVGIILHRFASYNQAANNNAAGVSVMLDVARTVGNGLVSIDETEQRADRDGVQVHGEQAAREAGVIPEDATVEYETDERQSSPKESLAAAKAAIAALTGKPVADKVPVADISSRLVQGGGTQDTPEATSVHFEVGETPVLPIRDIPADTTAAPAPFAADVDVETRPAAPAEPVEPSPSPESFVRETPEALFSGSTGVSSSVDKTPAWARVAQQKAHANKPELTQNQHVSRSRFADTVAAQMTDASLQSGSAPSLASALAQAAQHPEGEGAVSQTPQVPQTELEARLAALRDEIEATPAPQISSTTQSLLDNMQQAPQPPASVAPAVEQPASGDDVSRDAVIVSVADASAAADEAVPSVSPFTPLRSEENAGEDSAVAAAGKTAAISPIDVSAFINKEEQIEEPAPAPVTPIVDRFSREQFVPDTADAQNDEATRPVRLDEIKEAIREDVVDEPASVEPPRSEEPVIAPVVSKREVTQNPPAAPADQQRPPVVAPPVSPIMGMEDLAASLPSLTGPLGEEPSASATPERQVIVLPDVVSHPVASTEETKQRAPMADSTESTQSGTKSLLSNMLPRIDVAIPASQDAQSAEPVDSFGLDLPPLSAAPQSDMATVSATGSFSTVGGTGAFAPVGDELVADVAPDEIYVDDADDSAYEEEYTQTGAFAGPGYVDMPTSRAGRLFGRFRSKKKKNAPEPTVGEWVGADENYDARSVGKARGSWESFREEDDAPPAEDLFVDVDYSDDSFDNPRGWNGGAFSLGRLRRGTKDVDTEAEDYFEDEFDEDTMTSDAVALDDMPLPAYEPNPAEEINHELRRLQNFRHPDIDTEVWFVALGAELSLNSGMKAFLDEHQDELKGAIIINLEALGAGRLTFLEKEGTYRSKAASSRMRRFLRQASDRARVSYATGTLNSRETPAAVAMRKGYQAMTLAGMDKGATALFAEEGDILENLDETTLQDNSRFVLSILKSI